MTPKLLDDSLSKQQEPKRLQTAEKTQMDDISTRLTVITRLLGASSFQNPSVLISPSAESEPAPSTVGIPKPCFPTSIGRARERFISSTQDVN